MDCTATMFCLLCHFHLHEVHNSLNDQMNEARPLPTPLKKKKTCKSNMVTSGRRHVVDVVRAIVA